MRMTTEELHELIRRNPSLSIEGENRPNGICAKKPKCVKGKTLDCNTQREETGSPFDPIRHRITFEVYAVRPCDYDNYFCKPLQDLLVNLGFLPDDNWRVLEGCVISRRAKTKSEERTEITIEQL